MSPPIRSPRTLLAAGLLWLLPAASAATITQVPVALDTYAKENRPYLNFGTETRMEVRAAGTLGSGFGRYAFVKFAVPALQSPIRSARLRLRAGADLPEVGLFYLPNATFGEVDLVWAGMAPHIAGNVWIHDAGPAAAGAWLEYDVLGFIQGGGEVYFGLATETDQIDLWFYTREASAADAAVLVIDHGPTGSPALSITRSDRWYRPGYSSLGNLNAIQRGRVRDIPFFLRNTGSAPLTLPAPPSISGSTVMTASTPQGYPPSLQPGQETIVNVRLAPPASAPLGRSEGELLIPTGQLGTHVEDLFTYVTQGRDCDPGPMYEDLARVLDDLESATTGCWLDDYVTFNWGGSRNIPLITNAVRLLAQEEPSVATFFLRYVNAAVLGAAGGPGQPPLVFKYLLPDELGSHNYDATSVTGVLAARAWAWQAGDAALRQATRSWLRAYFTLAGLATVPAKVNAFIDENGTVYSAHPAGYQGPYAALAGQRSCPELWGTTTRPRMVGRALSLDGNAQGAPLQDEIWASLEARWGGSATADGSLYGLTPSEASQLRAAVAGTTCPTMVQAALGGIKTQARIDVAAWRASAWGAVRASTSGAVNQVNLFGVAYVPAPRFAAGNEAHMLYPWADPPYPACAGTPPPGSVQMILSGDKKMVYAPASGPPLTVDLPDDPHWYSLAIDPSGVIGWSCTPP